MTWRLKLDPYIGFLYSGIWSFYYIDNDLKKKEMQDSWHGRRNARKSFALLWNIYEIRKAHEHTKRPAARQYSSGCFLLFNLYGKGHLLSICAQNMVQFCLMGWDKSMLQTI